MKLYKNYLNEYEKGLMGYSTIAIIGQSCLGSIAVMFLFMNDMSGLQSFQLFLVTICCLFYNGAILSQQKAKISFNLLIISIVVSLLVIAINLI
ncbi:hypothetical protein [Flavivirga spongiicola]|uniref:DUF3953 domain-containing protein n=1 Tax=Flavivirga spongiicola TaxID=421621 RepID=A0ABU7XZ70_9FLAO|nr:hypothetical protein [Flavivirga sp. MEBiC05379]MDO5981085.1 hypothetical protein [Flavivirga sp. MEBiC05379]